MRAPRQVSRLMGCRGAGGLQGPSPSALHLCIPALAQPRPRPSFPTLIVTCQGVLSWAEALADMFPTPHMVSMSWETSVG